MTPTACPACSSADRGEVLTPDGPHHAKEVCVGCNRFFRWVAKPDADKAHRPSAHRELVKKYGRGFCEWCLRKEETLPANQVLEGHHVIPFKDGGSDERDNVLVLCTACHRHAHWSRTYLNSGASDG